MPEDRLLRIESNHSLGGGYFLLTLASERSLPPWRAGQFAMLSLGERRDPLLRRPFSIYNLHDPDESLRHLQFLVKVLGRGTAMLAEARPGDRLSCLFPLGRGFAPPDREGRRLLLVAGGVGVASLHPLAAAEARARRAPLLLFGCRSAEEIVAAEPTAALGIETRLSTDDGSAGFHGFVSDLLDSVLRAGCGAPPLVCACGPTAMMKATAEVARRHGAPCWLSLESTMACGFGICVGCVVAVRRGEDGGASYVRTCIEGPVMNAEEVLW